MNVHLHFQLDGSMRSHIQLLEGLQMGASSAPSPLISRHSNPFQWLRDQAEKSNLGKPTQPLIRYMTLNKFLSALNVSLFI